ncbi:MAG: helix-turn-helix transcriptional regulator [Sulfuricurvum sp.]|nr:helix-turn-helix transcriptional regulator [Sulfuricurvum sp.]
MTIGERIKKFREFLKITSQKEFSEILEIPFRTIQSYEQNKVSIPHTFLVKLIEKFNISTDWLLTGRGSMIDDFAQNDIPNQTKSFFLEAIKVSDFNFQEIDSVLSKYILSKYLQPLKEIRNSQGIWDRLFFNRFQNIGYMRILTRALIEAKENYKDEIFTVENSKTILRQIVNDYELRLTKDKINNLISEKTRQELLFWIDEELNDITCLVMLSDLDIAITAIKETLDKIDQISINLS